jgi:hypothetical protein
MTLQRNLPRRERVFVLFGIPRREPSYIILPG